MAGGRGRDDIYAVVSRIPRGRVATYGQVARLAGIPGHARQVGYALNDLPAGSPVPWHRVINAAGRVSGRSEPLEELIQRRLLESERVVFDGGGRVALSRYRWIPRAPRRPASVSRRARAGVSFEGPPCAAIEGSTGATNSMAKAGTTAGIGDEAVRARTGKSWSEWLAVLDAAGARKMTHRQIARHLADHHGRIGGWWCQMVAVGYEQARGLRAKHQKPDGYSVGATRTLAASMSALYGAWTDKRVRARWLPDAPLAIRKATRNKSMRMDWGESGGRLDVYFASKGKGKCQVAVQHNKLVHAKDAARMKRHWTESLDRLKGLLEGGSSGPGRRPGRS